MPLHQGNLLSSKMIKYCILIYSVCSSSSLVVIAALFGGNDVKELKVAQV